MDLDDIRPCAGRSIGGTLILEDGRRIAVRQIDHVGDDFLTFSRPGAKHPQMIAKDEISAWQAEEARTPPSADAEPAPEPSPPAL